MGKLKRSKPPKKGPIETANAAERAEKAELDMFPSRGYRIYCKSTSQSSDAKFLHPYISSNGRGIKALYFSLLFKIIETKNS